MKSAAAIAFRKVTHILSLSMAVLAVTGARVVADPIPVTQRQGSIHALLLLQDEGGKEIAVGDQTNEVRGNELHSRLTFRFHDGSVDDETTVFRQGAAFQLIYDHHIQKGPSFPQPADVTIDVQHGKVTWADPSGKAKKPTSRNMNLPADLANGLMALIVEDFPSKAAELKVSYLVVESKPRVVTFTVKPDGTDSVQVGSSGRQADRFAVHIDLGGITGAVASAIGKQPPDIKMWVLHGSVPILIKMVCPLYPQGPIWTMVLTAPSWPAER